MDEARTQNRLAQSTSPYLRQHADNPVDWFEWGQEALDKAKAEDKPILLSVGYSSCHWCHVMAHESFEEPQIAELMNDRFVNIKVDREERPDIDAIYQRVLTLMGEGGGWPLTVFLLPDQRPFYGGTYFPPTSKYGRPGFVQVLHALSELYAKDPAKVRSQAESFVEGFGELAGLLDKDVHEASGDPALDDPAAVRVASKRLLTKVDSELGGFGTAPKFPNSTALEIFAAQALADDPSAEDAANALHGALQAMHQGGIYDHLRGGFARYSTDREWLVPHFEKMLYDNAQLLPLYAEAAARWPEHTSYRDVVRETVEYLAKDMRTEDGTFYAATDADSEGVEGKYFCWTPAQLREVLDDEPAERFAEVYDVTERGNFEHDWSILRLRTPLREYPESLRAELEDSKAKLLAHRYERVPPHLDDKVLTSWNALLVSGLLRVANAADAWGDGGLSARSEQLALGALDHLLEHHIDEHGRVLRAGFQGQVHTRGFIDDVAYLGRAALDAHERTLEPRYLDKAAELAAYGNDHHLRRQRNGFLVSADDAERLLERTESHHDGPNPSGVGVMLELLARLDAAERAPDGAREVVTRILERFRGALANPFAYASVITAARFARPDAVHVTVRGPSADAVKALAAEARATATRSPAAFGLSFVEHEEPSALVCRGQVCTAPLTSRQALRDALA